MNPIFYTTLEQSKKLKELGIVQESENAWFTYEKMGNEQTPSLHSFYHKNWQEEEQRAYRNYKFIASAFSVGELGLMLQRGTPNYISYMQMWSYRDAGEQIRSYDYEAQARGEMLLDFLEAYSGEIKTINQRYLEAIK